MMAFAEMRNRNEEITMADKRKIEIFSAGCGVCADTIASIRARACPSCEIVILDMNEDAVARRSRALGINVVPAVLIDRQLAGCCTHGGPDIAVLERAGLGHPLT